MPGRAISRIVSLCALMSLAACSGDIAAQGEGSDPDGSGANGGNGIPGITTPRPFEPLPSHVYTSKVKNLLTGLPTTSGELDAVAANPAALQGLIDGWLQLPSAEQKLLKFFGNAFQQAQFIEDDLEDQGQIMGQGTSRTQILTAIREMFPRTALAIAKEGRSFAETVSGNRFQMTPALMVHLAYLDNRRRDDRGSTRDKLYQADTTASFSVVSGGAAIPIVDTLNPASPNYRKWQVATAFTAGCSTTRTFSGGNQYVNLINLILGRLDGEAGNTAACPAMNVASQLAPEDFTTWKWVTIRRPNAGEPTTRFYDLATIKNGNELVLDTQRVGFLSTVAFFANWRTNDSNLARVSTNQTLIVALGRSFDASNNVVPVSESGLDEEHANPTTECYGCHRTLDPMRQFFRKNYSLNYHEQSDPAQQSVTATFAVDGVSANGSTIADMARMLAEHPRYPVAWVQKLCYYANSAPCSEDDEELIRVASAFKSSGFNFKTLVRELFSSPLVTEAKRVKTFNDRDAVTSIARYDHLCGALALRLNYDVCNIDTKSKNLSLNMPSDGYSRGSEVPTLNSDTSLFFRAGTENLCRQAADRVVDNGGATGRYTSTTSGSRDLAMAAFVSDVMGLASADPRAAGLLQILKEHYAAVVAGGGTASNALKSTFVLACSSPTAVAVGL